MPRDDPPERRPTTEELRRRLYDGSGTEEDRARYRAALEAEQQALPAIPVESHPAPPHRRRTPFVVAAALALVVIAAILLALLPRSPAVPPAPSPAAIPVDTATRTGFLQNLAGGGAAGIAAYLVTHQAPPALRTATRFDTFERNGAGPHTLAVSPSRPDVAVSGRATVILVVESICTASWTAYRSATPTPGTGTGALVPITSRAGTQEGGVPTTTTFPYPRGEPPVRLHIDVPRGMRWGVAVVFTD